MKIKNYYKEPAYIHYSNCHEDISFIMSHITVKPERILSVASALDNALALLLLDPREIVAIDLNHTQIYLCELKKCGVKYLSYEQFLVLLGISEGDRLFCYELIRERLDGDTRRYFDGHLYLITQIGLVNCGRFEYYFSVFKNRALPLIHSKRTIEEFMSAETLEEQRGFYGERFDNLRFRLMFRLFFSEAVMKRLGRDKEFFKYNQGSVSALQKRKFESCIKNNLNRENPYLQYVILNRFDSLPVYLRKENFELIKKRIDRLTIKKTRFEDEIKECEPFDLMYLSDIFEYMDGSVMPSMTQSVTEALRDGGEVLLFNMMNPRRLGAPLTETELDQTHNLTFYYSKCYLYKKQKEKL